jgi:large repetitive protein
VTVQGNFSAQLSATGGTAPYVWAVANGTLPTGVTLNTTTGALSGTATAIGNFNFVAQVTDSRAQAAQKVFTVTVNPLPLEIAISAQTSLVQGSSFNGQATATGGAQPYTWSIVAGVLPAGISLNATTGAIAGIPTAAGDFAFTVEAKDAQGRTASRSFSIKVLHLPLAVESATASFEIMQGSTFAYQVKITGGTPSFSWSMASGSLPAGVALNPNTGVISGLASTSGLFSCVIQVRDQKPDTVSATLQIKVIDPNTVPLITRVNYKAGKRMVQVFGERFDPAASLWIDGAQINAKFSEGTLIVKKFPLAQGIHQIVVRNSGGAVSQPYLLRVE